MPSIYLTNAELNLLFPLIRETLVQLDRSIKKKSPESANSSGVVVTLNLLPDKNVSETADKLDRMLTKLDKASYGSTFTGRG